MSQSLLIPLLIPLFIPIFIPVMFPVMAIVGIFFFMHVTNKKNLKKSSSLFFKRKSSSIGKIEDKFIYYFKFSNYRPEQIDYKGVTDLFNLINEFKLFKWESELVNPNMKVLPTIGIQDKFTGYKLDISGISIENKIVYFNVYYVWPNRVRVMENQSGEKVRECIELFFNRDFNKLSQYFALE